MTQADKTDIFNLIASANELAKVAEDANAPYNDNAVADFAKAAIADAKAVNEFVLKVVQENIQHFADLTRIRIGGGCWGFEAIRRFNKEHKVEVGIGTNLFATLLIKAFVQRNDITTGYDEVYITANPEAVVVEKVYNNTSDTSLLFPDWEYAKTSIYNVCTMDDLFFKVDEPFCLTARHTPKEWKSIKSKSTWTRAKAALLVYSLKKQLVARVNGLRNTANERETIREENQKTTAYKKVGL